MARPKKTLDTLQRNLVKVYLTDDMLEMLEEIQNKLNVSKSQAFSEALQSLYCLTNFKE